MNKPTVSPVHHMTEHIWLEVCVCVCVCGVEQDVRRTLVVSLLQLHECDWHNRHTHPSTGRQLGRLSTCCC